MTKDEGLQALRASLQDCLTQIYQMRGMFDDADGTIQDTIDDAEETLRLTKELNDAKLYRSFTHPTRVR